MENLMKKQFIVLMGAAILASSASGLVIPVHQAYASELGTTANQIQASDPNKAVSDSAGDFASMVLNKWLSNLDVNTAAVSGKDGSEVSNSIANGATLAEASGLESSELATKLTDLFGQEMAYEVRTGVLSEKEAANLNQQLSNQIPGLVTSAWNGTGFITFLHNDGSDIIKYRLNRIVSDASALSEKSSIEVRRTLRDGHSLAEATGLDSATLFDYLTAKMNEDLDSAVKSGKLATDVLDKAKKTGAEKVGAIVNTKGYDVETTAWMEKYGQTLVNNKLDSIIEYTSIYANKDYSDVITALEAGQNLVSASGMAYSDLFALLTDDMNRYLETEWMDGSLSVKEVEQLKQSAAKNIDKALNQTGYGIIAEGSSDKGIAEESIRSIINTSATYIGSSEDELRAELAKGKSLLEATNLGETDLINLLQSSADSFIHQAVFKGWLKSSDEAATKTDAAALLKEAINKRGYTVQVDAKGYLEDRLGRIIDDVAAVSDTEANDLIKSLAQGKSLAEAANSDADTLLYKLLAQANKDMNKFEAVGSVNEKDAAVFKTDYATKVEAILNIN
jgi:hypothetical protein